MIIFETISNASDIFDLILILYIGKKKKKAKCVIYLIKKCQQHTQLTKKSILKFSLTIEILTPLLEC